MQTSLLAVFAWLTINKYIQRVEKQIRAACVHAACENVLRGEGYFEGESTTHIRKEVMTASSLLLENPFTG